MSPRIPLCASRRSGCAVSVAIPFFSGRISKLEDLLVVGSLVEEGQRASSESQLPIQAEAEVVERT